MNSTSTTGSLSIGNAENTMPTPLERGVNLAAFFIPILIERIVVVRIL